MNATAQVTSATPLADLQDVLLARAEVRAFLWWNYQMEMPEAVDPLQEYAKRSGLVHLIGQDAVQAIIAEPFARLRAPPIDDEPADDPAADQDIPQDVANLVRQWEMADPRDRWRHTGEPPPQPDVERPKPRPGYSTAASTVEAFLYVASLGNPKRLAAWLNNHPADKAELFKKWKGNKC